MLYKEWLSNWLENYVQPSAKQRTYTRYKEIVEQHIIPQLGDLELSEITPYVLQCYVTELLKCGNLRTGKGLSANSVNSIITVIQNTLKTACSLGIISEYVGDKIKRPRSSEKKVECFSMSEQKKIEEYILSNENTRAFGVLLCLYTGLRIGELLVLEWSDIDMSKGELQVNKTCHYGKDENGVFGRITDIPKTQSSIRTILIPKQLMPRLREVKKKSRSTHIVSNGSNLISIRSYQRSFSTLLKKLNIPHRGFHSLRHMFATQALRCGMDVKTLACTIGHESVETTLNVYSHATDEGMRTAAKTIDRTIGTLAGAYAEFDGGESEDEQVPTEAPKPTPRTKFEPYKGKYRRQGTGSIHQVSKNVWEGRYSPIVNGKRITRNIYAGSIEKCGEKLMQMIAEMKEEYGIA